MSTNTATSIALAEKARDLNAAFAGLTAQQMLSRILHGGVAGRVAVISSFGAESACLLSLVASKDPSTPIVFLDTRKHFAETLTYVDDLMDRLGLTTLVRARPSPARLEVDDPHGELHAIDADRCCFLRKTLPMIGVLRNYDCVLTGRIRSARLARAYSVHTVMGTLGWAAAPISMTFLAHLYDWRVALAIGGAAGLICAAVVALDKADLILPHLKKERVKTDGPSSLSLFLSAPILMALVYFTLLSTAFTGVQNYLPTLLPVVQGVSLQFATTVTTFYLTVYAVGSLVGGWLADRAARHDQIIGFGLIPMMGLVLAIGYLAMPAPLLVLAAMGTGFFGGMTIPSRDMLVRAATPQGSEGRVFGFVYSGLDLGALIAPPVIGYMLDHGAHHAPFIFIAATLFVTLAPAFFVARRHETSCK
jgi:MFS family permease